MRCSLKLSRGAAQLTPAPFHVYNVAFHQNIHCHPNRLQVRPRPVDNGTRPDPPHDYRRYGVLGQGYNVFAGARLCHLVRGRAVWHGTGWNRS